MNQQPITTAQYNALPDEKKELYNSWPTPEIIGCHWYTVDKAVYDRTPDKYRRLMHYPKPEASQQPTQQNAPLINEGGETADVLNAMLIEHEWLLNEYNDKEDANQSDDILRSGFEIIKDLQTALAEANNKIAELEVQINAQKRQLKQQDKHKRMIKGLWLSMCEENKTLKDAVKDYFDSGCQVRIDSFEEFISQYGIED